MRPSTTSPGTRLGPRERWYEGLVDALEGLRRMPGRWAPAPEDEVLRFGLRHLVHGRYRVLFTVDETDRTVHVLHIRHGVRRQLERGDLNRLS